MYTKLMGEIKKLEIAYLKSEEFDCSKLREYARQLNKADSYYQFKTEGSDEELVDSVYELLKRQFGHP